jgi:nicotinate-nucleotide adenylyltransferase
MGYDCGEHKNLPNVTFVPAPRIEISATLIRNSIAQKKSVKYLLPTKVEQFIDDMQLYQLKK